MNWWKGAAELFALVSVALSWALWPHSRGDGSGPASALEAALCETSQLGVCNNHITTVCALGKACRW